MVDEDVSSVGLRDEAVALLRVEPLNYSGRHGGDPPCTRDYGIAEQPGTAADCPRGRLAEVASHLTRRSLSGRSSYLPACPPGGSRAPGSRPSNDPPPPNP